MEISTDENDVELIIELLKEKKSVKMFKITSRIGISHHKQICELLLKNNKDGKKKSNQKKKN